MSSPIQRPSVYLDYDLRPAGVASEHITALRRLGIDELQAAFAARVMYLGSVFLPTHADVWLSQTTAFSLDAPAHQRRSLRTRFLQDLFRSTNRLRPIAKRFRVPNIDLQYGRMDSRYHYELIGLQHSRYARVLDNTLAVARLMLFDFMIRHTEFTWYGATSQKVDLFKDLDIPESVWPSRVYQSKRPGVPSTRVFFPEHRPIGVSDWRLCFPFSAPNDRAPASFHKVVGSHAPLFDALRSRGLQVTVVLCHKRGAGLEDLIDQHVAPVQGSDRKAFVSRVWLQIVGLAVEAGDRAFIDAQGGVKALRAATRDCVSDLRHTATFKGRVADLRLHECTDVPIEIV